MYRSRTRRIAKWTGLVVCVVLLASWGISFRFTCGVTVRGLGLGFGEGCHILVLTVRTDGINWGARRTSEIKWWPGIGDRGRTTVVMLPGWLTLPAIAIPTVRLWRRDRRHPPGHCQRCGYDLTGNVTGVCSECATKVES